MKQYLITLFFDVVGKNSVQRDTPKGSLPFSSPFPSSPCHYYLKALKDCYIILKLSNATYVRLSVVCVVGVADMTLQSLQCNSKASRM